MPKGAEAVIRLLEGHDVEHVFGVCGDTSIGLYRAFEEMDHELTHVLARDERGASFMADAYARFSDKPGVCEAPSGGGATYLLSGVAEANDSAIPLVALNTNVPTRYRGRGVLTELDQGELFDTVTKWNQVVDDENSIPYAVRQAFRKATTDRPGATHLSFPMDTLNGETNSDLYADENVTRYPAYRPSPSGDRIERAARLLETSENPVIVVGGGVYSSRASDAVRDLAEKTGTPVAQTLTSVGCIGSTPYSIGVVGENGSREYADEIVGEADALFIFGSAVESVWTEKWSNPADGETRIVHADIDAGSIGKNYATDVPIPGDLRETATALVDRVEPRTNWDASILKERHDEWLSTFAEHFDSDEFPLRPERIVADTRDVLESDSIIVSDPGTSCPYFAALYEFQTTGRNWVTPRAHGALGYTIPGVVGAHFAQPDAQLVGFTGDGSFGTSAGDLETIARYDLPVTIVVINNDSFSWIEAGQRSYADFSFGVDFQDLDHAAIAEEFGLAGYRIGSADEYKSKLREAVERDGPSLIDLPTRPLPTLEDTPVDWLEPDE